MHGGQEPLGGACRLAHMLHAQTMSTPHIYYSSPCSTFAARNIDSSGSMLAALPDEDAGSEMCLDAEGM